MSEYVTPRGLRVPAVAVRFAFSRASGPGGQHVNKADTKVRVTIDLGECGFDEARQERLTKRLGAEVHASADDHRSQWRNRELALKRALVQIDRALDVQRPRRPSQPTAASKERRLEAKARQARRKAMRRRVSEVDDG